MQDKSTKCSFLNIDCFLFIFVVFNRFLVAVGFASDFRANFCHWVLAIFTRKHALLNLDSQIAFALICNLATSSVVVDLRAKVSPATAEDEVRYQHHDRHRLASFQRNRDFFVSCWCILLSDSAGYVRQ